MLQWLSPPDPSMNHDIIWKAHHSETTPWFLDSNLFKEWKANGSLLWVSGKSMFLQMQECHFR